MGSLVVSAVLRRDYPVIQGALLIIAAIYVLINLFIDLLYLLVDPASAIDGGPPPMGPPRSAARFPSRGMPADRQSRLRGIPWGCILVRCRQRVAFWSTDMTNAITATPGGADRWQVLRLLVSRKTVLISLIVLDRADRRRAAGSPGSAPTTP